jgi:GNAT superfamily N-acetyltransferase
MIELRDATPGECELAYSIKRAAFREYVEPISGWSEEEQHRLHEEWFSSHRVQIIHAAGTDVGVLATGSGTDCVSLHQLFILPEHQGQGIGRQCMERVMETAAELGLPVRLRVLKTNPRARVFYERLSFACTGETITHFLMEWARPTDVGCDSRPTAAERQPNKRLQLPAASRTEIRH